MDRFTEISWSMWGLVLLGILIFLASIGGMFLYSSDIRMDQSTPVEEYEGEYIEFSDLNQQQQETLLRVVESDKPVKVSGFVRYRGDSILYEGVVYELDQSTRYFHGITEPDWQ